MNAVIMKALQVLGWKKLLSYAWRLAKPQLEKAAKKTETSFDDDCVKVVDEILSSILNDKAA